MLEALPVSAVEDVRRVARGARRDGASLLTVVGSTMILPPDYAAHLQPRPRHSRMGQRTDSSTSQPGTSGTDTEQRHDVTSRLPISDSAVSQADGAA